MSIRHTDKFRIEPLTLREFSNTFSIVICHKEITGDFADHLKQFFVVEYRDNAMMTTSRNCECPVLVAFLSDRAGISSAEV